MMTSFQSNHIGGESYIPPEDRIITNLAFFTILVGRMKHYGDRVNDPALCKELSKLERQVERTMAAAKAVRGDEFLLTDAGRAALNGEEMSREQLLERELCKLESAGYPGSESEEFKRACLRMNEIEKELKSIRAANQKIKGTATQGNGSEGK